jgi:hypothetical protein
MIAFIAGLKLNTINDHKYTMLFIFLFLTLEKIILLSMPPNVEVTGPKLTAVFDSRGGATEGSEHGVRK